MLSVNQQVAHNTTFRLVSANSYIPSPLWSAFESFHRVHTIWWWYRRGRIYSNPDNFIHLVAGHSLNYLIGDNIVFHVAAQCVLVATRILECVQQAKEVQNSYNQFVTAICGGYPHRIKRKWCIAKEGDVLSPSTVNYTLEQYDRVKFHTMQIAIKTWTLMADLFKLSMYIMDTVEAFNMSPSSRYESIGELFVNGMQWLDQLVENKEELQQKLKVHRLTIHRILQSVHARVTVDEMITIVDRSLDKAEAVHKVINQVNGKVREGVVDLVKRGAFGALEVLGIADWAPRGLAPPLRPQFLEPERPPIKKEKKEQKYHYPAMKKEEWKVKKEVPFFSIDNFKTLLSS